MLALQLHADFLLLLTDTDAVYAGWGTAQKKPIRHASPEELRKYRFAEGSMGPKVAAACAFVEKTGGGAGIGSLSDAHSILRGTAGTLIKQNGN